MNNQDLMQKKNDNNYPEITVSSITNEEKSILLNIFSGSKSELTSLAQYSFQHIYLSSKEEFKHYSSEIEKISLTEMLHFEIIGKILNKCGYIPKFCTYIDNNPNICNYWSSGNTNFSTLTKDITLANIALEETGIREYKKLLEITKNENLKEITKRILEDEYLHLELFNKMLENIEKRQEL